MVAVHKAASDTHITDQYSTPKEEQEEVDVQLPARSTAFGGDPEGQEPQQSSAVQRQRDVSLIHCILSRCSGWILVRCCDTTHQT
jgi:hypothetical protein